MYIDEMLDINKGLPQKVKELKTILSSENKGGKMKIEDRLLPSLK